MCSGCTPSAWRNAATTRPPSPRAGGPSSCAKTISGRSTRWRTCWKCRGGSRKARRFLAQPYGSWDDRNPFRQHLWWHTALFPLELGQYDRVLELYDRAVRAELSDFYLDIQNAASMLFRLEWCGVDVGQRWSELADIAEKRIDDHVMAFTDLHLMLALCRDGRLPKAEELIASFRAFASDTGERHRVDHGAGGDSDCRSDSRLRHAATTARPWIGSSRRVISWPVVGASHAQRDLFSLLLIAAAQKSGRSALARALLAERVELKPHSVASWLHYGDALDKLGDQAAVAARERAANEARRVSASA